MSITIHFKNGTELTTDVNSENDIPLLLADKSISTILYNDEEEY